MARSRARVSALGVAIVVLLGVGVGSLAGRAMRPSAAPVTAGKPSRRVAARSLRVRSAVVVRMPAGLHVGIDYLAGGGGYLDELHLTASPDRRGGPPVLTGTARAIQAAGEAPEQAAESATFDVEVRASAGRLVVSFVGSGPERASLRAGTLAVAFPEPDGTEQPVVLRTASLRQVDAALAAFNAGVARANRRALVAEGAIRSDGAAVSAGIARLRDLGAQVGQAARRVAVTAGIQGGQATAAKEAADQLAATTTSRHPTPATAANSCRGLSAVAASVASVEATSAAIGTDAGRVADVVGQVGAASRALDGAEARLAAAEARAPGARLRVPGTGAVGLALARAEATDRAALAMVNAAIALANGQGAEAYQAADETYTALGCSRAPTPPAQLEPLAAP